MKIKVLEKTPGCMPEILEVGDWIDLRAAKDIHLAAPYANTLHRKRYKNSDDNTAFRDVQFHYTMIPLGVAIGLPKGYEAYLLPRSSTFKNYGVLQTNSKGIIDYSYCGNNDEWKLPVVSTREVTIPKGTRIAQFRIQLSQKATVWQKLRWLFTSKIKLERVSSLSDNDRGGFGEGTKNNN